MPDDKPIFFIDSGVQDPSILEQGPDECPDCKVPYEVGFGLAGGGYGPYTFCPQCDKILSKQQETDANEPPTT